MRRLGFLLLAGLLLGAAGCGGDGLKRVPVRGRITAQGVPLDEAVIQFLPAGSTRGEGGIGRSDNEGNYSLTGSRNGIRGVVPGDYRVRVSRLVAPDGTPLGPDGREADTPGSHESLPREFASLDATPLKFTVPPSGGVVDIDIPAKVLRRK